MMSMLSACKVPPNWVIPSPPIRAGLAEPKHPVLVAVEGDWLAPGFKITRAALKYAKVVIMDDSALPRRAAFPSGPCAAPGPALFGLARGNCLFEIFESQVNWSGSNFSERRPKCMHCSSRIRWRNRSF
jgi:hypothetical protein